jgi:hypothetical protein
MTKLNIMSDLRGIWLTFFLGWGSTVMRSGFVAHSIGESAHQMGERAGDDGAFERWFPCARGRTW